MKKLLLISMLALMGCRGLIDLLSPSLPPVGECFGSVTVEVYADRDGDGLRDPDEPPLEGIAVGIITSEDPPQIINSAETSADGTAEIHFITGREDCGGSYLVGVLATPGQFVPPPDNLRPVGEVEAGESGQTLIIGLLLAEPTYTPTP